MGTLTPAASWSALASQAAAALGSSSSDIVRGILAQWSCEQAGSWPPTRNNPGNIARGLALDIGIPFRVTFPNPQPGNPIVTYASPADGVRAYSSAILRFSRYAPARQAAAAGDGLGFIRAIGSSGWGTGTSCMLGAYKRLGGTVYGGAVPPSGSSSAPAADASGPLVAAVYTASTAAACSQYLILSPGSAVAELMGAFPIPAEDIGKPCVKCADGWNPGVVTNIAGYLGGWTDPGTLPSGTANACVKAGIKPGDRLGPAGAPGSLLDGTLIAGALSAIPDQLGQVMRSTATFAALLALTGAGLWLLVTSRK